MEKILIVEDDADIREGVRILLEGEGYSVSEAENGRKGLELLKEETDLVILDVMMPGMSGLKTCEEIRKVSYVPVLFLTARSQESKPFSYSELLGRVKALIRRWKIYRGKEEPEQMQTQNYIELAGIRLNEEFNEVTVKGENVEFSDIEYNILRLLLKYPGKIFSAQNLYESVWNEPYFYNCNSTVMVHIRRLRVKIEEDPKNPKLILTVWGKGYRFGEH